ncbi:MAG: hypothetical protein MHM6MM_006019 [Cercozoa sp. M6MM]
MARSVRTHRRLSKCHGLVSDVTAKNSASLSRSGFSCLVQQANGSNTLKTDFRQNMRISSSDVLSTLTRRHAGGVPSSCFKRHLTSQELRLLRLSFAMISTCNARCAHSSGVSATKQKNESGWRAVALLLRDTNAMSLTDKKAVAAHLSRCSITETPVMCDAAFRYCMHVLPYYMTDHFAEEERYVFANYVGVFWHDNGEVEFDESRVLAFIDECHISDRAEIWSRMLRSTPRFCVSALNAIVCTLNTTELSKPFQSELVRWLALALQCLLQNNAKYTDTGPMCSVNVGEVVHLNFNALYTALDTRIRDANDRIGLIHIFADRILLREDLDSVERQVASRVVNELAFTPPVDQEFVSVCCFNETCLFFFAGVRWRADQRASAKLKVRAMEQYQEQSLFESRRLLCTLLTAIDLSDDAGETLETLCAAQDRNALQQHFEQTRRQMFAQWETALFEHLVPDVVGLIRDYLLCTETPKQLTKLLLDFA